MMLTFVLEKSWELRAEDLASAKEIVRRLEILAPDEMIETKDNLFTTEDSLIDHWGKVSR